MIFLILNNKNEAYYMGFISSTHGEMMHFFTHLKGRLGGQNVAANLAVTD